MDETSYQEISHANIEMLAPEQATIRVDIDAQCFLGSMFGAHCAHGGGAEVTDSRTFISVDTAPIADAIETSTFGICVTIFAVAFMKGVLR